jgi:hypothetical protein
MPNIQCQSVGLIRTWLTSGMLIKSWVEILFLHYTTRNPLLLCLENPYKDMVLLEPIYHEQSWDLVSMSHIMGISRLGGNQSNKDCQPKSK